MDWDSRPITSNPGLGPETLAPCAKNQDQKPETQDPSMIRICELRYDLWHRDLGYILRNVLDNSRMSNFWHKERLITNEIGLILESQIILERDKTISLKSPILVILQTDICLDVIILIWNDAIPYNVHK